MSDQFGMPMVDCRPTHEVITELRQQVTLLRTVMNRIAFSRTGQCVSLTQELFAREKWAAEALAATEPKEN